MSSSIIPNSLVKVVIADDHPLILAGLANELEKIEGIIIVARETNGLDAIKAIDYHKPHLVILDVQMPGKTGLEIAKYIKENEIQAEVILLTMFHDLSFIEMARKVGVSGYLLKEYIVEEVRECIEVVVSGGRYLSKSFEIISSEVQQQFSELSQLSRMERKIIRMISEGKTSEQIAELLFISPKTVENHRYNMAKKLNLESYNNSLVRYAMDKKKMLEFRTKIEG